MTFPRTGGNYLCSLLNSHPEIICHYEVFHLEEIYYADEYHHLNLCTLKERDRRPEEFLNRLWKASFSHNIVGFKIFPHHNRTAFTQVMEDGSVRKLLLSRKNRIRTYVSLLIAYKTNQWSTIVKVAEGNPIKVVVDVNSLHKFVKENNKIYNELKKELKKSKQKFIELTYEDLVAGKENHKIFDYLGASHYELRSNLRRQNPYSLKSMIANYRDLEVKLRGTELENELFEKSF